MKRVCLVVLALALGLGPAGAQTSIGPVTQVAPYRASTAGGNRSGSIAATGTFQKIFDAAKLSPGASGATGVSRKGCTIRNNSNTNMMYVSEGQGIAGSSVANSLPVPPGTLYSCAVGVIVLDGEIDISGTAGDTFYAAQY